MVKVSFNGEKVRFLGFACRKVGSFNGEVIRSCSFLDLDEEKVPSCLSVVSVGCTSQRWVSARRIVRLQVSDAFWSRRKGCDLQTEVFFNMFLFKMFGSAVVPFSKISAPRALFFPPDRE